MIDHTMIEAFLNIVEYGNLTSAAAHMFSSQSSLSRQIKQLEEQVGKELIVRRKGRTETELTEAGKEFLQTAEKWRDVMREFDEVGRSGGMKEVSIAAPERVNSIILRDFYRSVMDEMPGIRLDIHTRHRQEVCSMLEERRADLGIVSLDLPLTGIRSTLLREENLCVIVCGTEHEGALDPGMLDGRNEVYSRWSDEFALWHDRYWPGRQYRIHVGSNTMIPSFLDREGRWALITESMTAALEGLSGLSVHPLSVPTPKSSLYLLEQKTARREREEAVRLIRDGIVRELSARQICEKAAPADHPAAAADIL